ncbi:SDR family NAD(P)-dependent oxidoreductase [Paenarthrobacter sp. NPDC089989]|uniref:SDR family NAD(P)-dependent oxidoreductase n=1 Tax=unclassified Paenarthrobacter TaxID=2634190 RepID=UPI003827968C
MNVASTAAFQPIPRKAVYGATKAFVLSFTEAVAHETKDSDLRVLALCPGATRTEFFDVLGSESATVGVMQTSEQVVETALKALGGKRSRLPSPPALCRTDSVAGPALRPKRASKHAKRATQREPMRHT